MLATMTSRRDYDHRMRDLVCEVRDPGLFKHLGAPRSIRGDQVPADLACSRARTREARMKFTISFHTPPGSRATLA
jgi:hypothetical protein